MKQVHSCILGVGRSSGQVVPFGGYVHSNQARSPIPCMLKLIISLVWRQPDQYNVEPSHLFWLLMIQALCLMVHLCLTKISFVLFSHTLFFELMLFHVFNLSVVSHLGITVAEVGSSHSNFVVQVFTHLQTCIAV